MELAKANPAFQAGVNLCAEDTIAITVWNTLGGLDWAGLPLVAQLHGVEDLDLLVERLVTIREFQAKLAEEARGNYG